MTDLAAFLLARIDEDERFASAAVAAPWRVYENYPGMWCVDSPAGGIVYEVQSGDVDEGTARHVACWDPARVLAECGAKRALVEYLAGSLSLAIKILAQPYTDHPDFNASWRLPIECPRGRSLVQSSGTARGGGSS